MRVLPADVHDALELSALVHKGIGQPWVFESYDVPVGERCPVCIHGHASFLADKPDEFTMDNPINRSLEAVGIDGIASDEAVGRINKRKGCDKDARVSWKQYARELNIVRGK